MDFGIGFLTNNVMLPILDFFYGIVPSYGFAIIALTLVIRFAVFPLSANQIRNMRKMRIAQPLMKERQEEIQKRYKDNPEKQREEMGKLMQEFGNPLAGCLPLLLQMPILFALFATLRGSPFADVNYNVNLQIFPQEQIERLAPQTYTTKPQNIYINDGIHYPITAVLPAGNKLVVGEKTKVEFQTSEGKELSKLVAEKGKGNLQPRWKVTKGEERLQINEDGTIVALEPGDATIQLTVPGIAANEGFLFIQALGRIGATGEDGKIHWDILGMVMFFGVSLYINQLLSGQQGGGGNAQQQQTVNKLMPILLSGMFLFFPLPAGVLMYIVIANVFQTLQTFILMREPLPENLQKLVEAQEKAEQGEREALPFERKRSKKKEKTSG
ncbi:MAG: membrane protein insertase YidC [Oscillatoria sp. PMC 1051.18]|nr:membrane protein insertase YidC [Oscillatoria sp. PMC 1050.18]MEC5031760.1 membrane protein insertase YidC [Oscillatoria sp. PMC 1051.18]